VGKDYYLFLNQDEKAYFSLPEKWVPLHFVESTEGDAIPPVRDMASEALSMPIGTSPFRDLLSQAEQVAVIVDDGTRPTPVAEILNVLDAQITEVGFPRENVTIVVALGTHEPMEKNALEARLGPRTFSRYKVVQHNAWQADLVPVKVPGVDREVRINPVVARADLRVGISSVLPHSKAGYGGGPKILMPGISDFEYVRDHHMKYMTRQGVGLGALEGNPFHEGILKTAQAIGLHFSLNCLYDRKGRVIRIIGGSLEKAFPEAVKLCLDKLGHKFAEKADVTIASTFPHNHGHQLFKGVRALDAVTRDSGAILLVAPIVAPISPDFVNCFRVINEKSNNNAGAYVRDALARGVAFLPDKSIDFNMAMSVVFTRPKIRIILVSPMISKDEALTMGLEYAPSIEAGLGVLEKTYPNAKVAIFPAGGLIVPVTAW
jgi:lactate racemase